MMNSRMRGYVIKAHNGRKEITSMDEELPITIFIVSRCTSKQFFSNLEYVNLYRKAREIVNNEELDYEEKTITNVVVQIFNNIL